jgi:hypothetical protein
VKIGASMARRPANTEHNFLAFIFGPKRNPKPVGLRKTQLSGIKGGRTKARLAAFNRMSPVNQEVLKRSGMREQYLRGEVKISDAKLKLREIGVRLGVAKPTPAMRAHIPAHLIVTPLDRLVADHLKRTIRAEGISKLNPQHVDENVMYASENDLGMALSWGYPDIKYAGRRGSEYEVTVNGVTRNPFWYH